MPERNDELCDCIKSENDKEELLIVLDEAIRKENEEISKIREHKEKAEMLMKKEDKNTDFYYSLKDSISIAPRLEDLHEDYIVRLKGLRRRLENTKMC